MEKFCINVNGAKVRYISDIPLQEYFIKNKEFMEFYNAQIVTDSMDIKYTVEYYDTNDSVEPLIVTDSKMIVKYSSKNITESILIYLGFHFLERQFGEMGMCSCHSACVEKNGKALLILGDAGSGKTSLAVNLCLNNGFKLVSNDMTLIGHNQGNLYVYGGTKFINLRLLSVKQNMPFLTYLFENDNKDDWTNKISIMARDIGIMETYDILPIENIMFLHIDSREKFKISNGDNWRNNFLLYQNLSSNIRGTAATFIDKNGHPIGYIPSFETRETYEQRVQLINLINQSENYNYVTGNLNDIIEYIDNLYKKNVKVLRGDKK